MGDSRGLYHYQSVRHHKFCLEAFDLPVGVPRELVADNGTQFQNNKLKELCDTYHMKFNFAFVSYPQSNGQAKATNKVILNIIKKILEQSKGKWVEELWKVL